MLMTTFVSENVTSQLVSPVTYVCVVTYNVKMVSFDIFWLTRFEAVLSSVLLVLINTRTV